MPAVSWLPTYAQHAFEIRECYAEFWTEVGKLVGDKLTPKSLRLEPQLDGEHIRVEFGREGDPLAFLAVSNTGTLKNRTHDIYLSGKQLLRKATVAGEDTWLITRSEFKILYLDAEEKARIKRAWRDQERIATPYAGYRFLSDVPPNVIRHFPDCRVHHKLDALPEAYVQRYFQEEPPVWKERLLHSQLCVPTAPMDLAAIVYLLLHGHCSNSVRDGWPRPLSDLVMRLPSFHFDADKRSLYRSWYDHSHTVPSQEPPKEPRRWPDSFHVPSDAAAAGWGARIAGRERNEDPHITINRGKDRDHRLNLRTKKMMSGNESEVPQELLLAIYATWAEWCQLWDTLYPNDKLRSS